MNRRYPNVTYYPGLGSDRVMQVASSDYGRLEGRAVSEGTPATEILGPPSPGWDRFDLPAEEVQQRFRWARRHGHPAWLWPDVRAEQWREALDTIAQVVARVLKGGPPPLLYGDERAIGLAAYTSGLGPLLGWWLEQGQLTGSPAVAAVLRLHLWHNARRMDRVERAAKCIIGGLSHAGIQVLLLKGLHTGTEYFPHPATRPVSDIDILVNAVDVAAAEDVLRRNGLTEQGRNARESTWIPAGLARYPRSLMLVHADDPWSVDLHNTLDLAAGAGSPVARLDRGLPLHGDLRWSPDARGKILDQPLLVLHLAAHAGSGLHSLSLLRLVELHLVIGRDIAAGCFSWDEFLALGALTGALGFAFPALLLCERLVPGTIPSAVLNHCAAAAPSRARRVVARLNPATAQRVERSWISEHYMWVRGPWGWGRQLASDLFPSVGSWQTLSAIYQRRLWRLLRGRILT